MPYKTTESRRKHMKAYYKKNAPRIKAQMRDWYKENRERKREYNKGYYRKRVGET